MHKSMQTLVRSTQAARSKSTNFFRLKNVYAGSTQDERSEKSRHKKRQGTPARHATPYSHPAGARLESTSSPPAHVEMGTAARLAIRRVQFGGRNPHVLKSKVKESTVPEHSASQTVATDRLPQQLSQIPHSEQKHTQLHPNGRAGDAQPVPTWTKKPATHQKRREKKFRPQSHLVPIRKVLTTTTEPAAPDATAEQIPSNPSPSPSPLIRKVSSHPISSPSLAYLTSQRLKNRLRRRAASRSRITVPIKHTLSRSRQRPLSEETASIFARTSLLGKTLARLTTQLCIATRLDPRRLPTSRHWRAGGKTGQGAGPRSWRVRRTMASQTTSGGRSSVVSSQRSKKTANRTGQRGLHRRQQRSGRRKLPVRRVRDRMKITRFVVRERRLEEEIGSWLGGGGSSGGFP